MATEYIYKVVREDFKTGTQGKRPKRLYTFKPLQIGAVSRGICRIGRDIGSRVRWYKIRLRTYPAELAQRRRRRQMMRDYIQRLREMPPEERGRNPEESEA